MSKHHQVQSITDTWLETWKIFHTHFIKLIFITAIPLAITYAFTYSTIGSFIFSFDPINPGNMLSASSGFLYFAIIALIVIIITDFWGAVAIVVATIYYDKLKISKIFTKALEFFWTFVILGLLSAVIFTIALILGYILITIIAIIIGLISTDFLKNHFVDLDFIPYLTTAIASFFLIFSPYFIVEDKDNAVIAIRKSYRLIKSYFFPTMIRLLIASSILSTIVFLSQLLPYIGEELAVLISIPLTTVYTYVIYKDLKPKNK